MRNKKYQIISYHGWGFNPDIWKPLQAELEPFVYFENANRGYFSDSFEPVWKKRTDSSTEKIVLVHSYGLHWCSDEILENADHLVLISSFLNFHPSGKQQEKRSKLLLQKMLAQFVQLPRQVLEKFYEEVFYPEAPKLEVQGRLNHDRLLSDLSDLDRDIQGNAKVFDMNSITIIHGDKDRIVDNEIARTMYSKLRFRSQYFEIKQGGHGLPFTHSSKIFEILNSLLHFK